MNQVILVGIGGCIGSILRFGLSNASQRWAQSPFPWGTLLVNMIGCFAAGVVWSVVEHRQWLSPDLRVFITVGILGGFTTFSAFSHETFTLVREGYQLAALGNVAGSVVLGLLAVASGWTLVKIFAT